MAGAAPTPTADTEKKRIIALIRSIVRGDNKETKGTGGGGGGSDIKSHFDRVLLAQRITKETNQYGLKEQNSALVMAHVINLHPDCGLMIKYWRSYRGGTEELRIPEDHVFEVLQVLEAKKQKQKQKDADTKTVTKTMLCTVTIPGYLPLSFPVAGTELIADGTVLATTVFLAGNTLALTPSAEDDDDDDGEMTEGNESGDERDE
jgi:hypothetical protein